MSAEQLICSEFPACSVIPVRMAVLLPAKGAANPGRG
jgi:hypothetical protein